MPRYNRDVERTLLGKFAFVAAPGTDHRWFQLKLPGLPPIITKFSHTKEDIRDPLWQKIAQQLRVRPQYLTGMIDCHNSREAYYQQVRTAPNPPWPHFTREVSAQPDLPSKRRGPKKKRKAKRKR